MKENHRQAYLSALNIDNYMPRWILPGAPVSTECLWEVVSADAEQTTGNTEFAVEQTPSEKTAVASNTTAADTLGQLKEVAGKQVAKPETDAAQVKLSAQVLLKQQQSVAPAARYSLTLWQISESLMVLDSRQSELALPTDALLQNILRSVAISGSLPKADILRWPLTQSAVVDSGIQQAREHLATLLGAKFSGAAAPSLWTMGDTAAHYVLTQEQQYESLLGQCIAFQNEWFGSAELTVCVLPSLVEMLQTPTTKKIAWQGLQAWSKRIEQGATHV